MKKLLKILFCLFVTVLVVSLASCGEEHNYGELHERVEPTFLKEGNIAYYECSHCHKYFDSSKNEVESITIEKYSKDISLQISFEYIGDFTVEEENENHIVWTYSHIDLERDTTIRVVDKKNQKLTRKYTPNTETNITERGSIYNNAKDATITLEATPNGVILSVSGDKTLSVKYNYKQTMTDMIPNEKFPNVYEIKNVKIMEGDLFNVVFLDGYYFSSAAGKGNPNFKTWMEDEIMYLKCYLSGIYNVSFDINGRNVYIELVEEIPHYTYYFHKFNSSGNLTMKEIEDSNEVVLKNVWMSPSDYYYVLKANDKDSDETYSYGELDQSSLSLGESADFEVTKMFKVNAYAEYDVYFNTETNEFRLDLIEVGN